MLQTYDGGCHCGQVRFRVQADLAEISQCNCSICMMKGIIHLVVPAERFSLLRGEAELTTYQFGTHTAKHIFCRHCGIHSFYVPRAYPDRISVNPRCFDGIDATTLHPSRFFDGRDWEAAMQARRAADAAGSANAVASSNRGDGPAVVTSSAPAGGRPL